MNTMPQTTTTRTTTQQSKENEDEGQGRGMRTRDEDEDDEGPNVPQAMILAGFPKKDTTNETVRRMIQQSWLR